MSAVVTGVIVTAAATGYSISSAEKAKKTTKHAKERAVGKSRELKAKAAEESALEKSAALASKRKRMAGVNRNLNLFGGMGGKADRVSKILTGQ